MRRKRSQKNRIQFNQATGASYYEDTWLYVGTRITSLRPEEYVPLNVRAPASTRTLLRPRYGQAKPGNDHEPSGCSSGVG